MNVVVLGGRIGSTRTHTQEGGKPFLTLSVGTTEWTGHAEKTVWHDCVWFDFKLTPEVGQMVMVHGDLTYRKDDKGHRWSSVRVWKLELVGQRPSRKAGR